MVKLDSEKERNPRALMRDEGEDSLPSEKSKLNAYLKKDSSILERDKVGRVRNNSTMKVKPETEIQYDENGIRIETKEMIKNWEKI